MNGVIVLARDADGVKIIELLVLPWSRPGRVAKERLMEGDVFAPVFLVSHWQKVRFVQNFREDKLGRPLGLLRKWCQAEDALKTKEVGGWG